MDNLIYRTTFACPKCKVVHENVEVHKDKAGNFWLIRPCNEEKVELKPKRKEPRPCTQ